MFIHVSMCCFIKIVGKFFENALIVKDICVRISISAWMSGMGIIGFISYEKKRDRESKISKKRVVY